MKLSDTKSKTFEVRLPHPHTKGEHWLGKLLIKTDRLALVIGPEEERHFIEVFIEEGAVKLMCGTSIVIQPMVSNVISLRFTQ